MTKLKKLAISNPEFIQKCCEMVEAKTGYPCYSLDSIVRLCDDSENTAMFLEFYVSPKEHKILCEYLNGRCYKCFGDGQLECGRDDLAEPLWCVNWLENRTQAYKAYSMLRKMGIIGKKVGIVKGIDCELVCFL